MFLVSVKLILMAYKSGVSAAELSARLARIERTLAEIDHRLEERKIGSTLVSDAPAGATSTSVF